MKRAVESSIERRVVEMSGISESCLVPWQVRRAATLLRTKGPTGMAPGIYCHGMAWRLRYCHELGYRVVVDATIVGNMPSLRSQDTYDPRIRAFCRYRRFVHWRDWKEL